MFSRSSMFKLNWDNEAPQITIERMDEPAHCHEINTEGVVGRHWFHGISKHKNVLKELQSMTKSSWGDSQLSSSWATVSYTSAIMIAFCSVVWTKLKLNRLWLNCIMVPLAPTQADIRWLRRFYGQAITGLPWKLTAINTPRPVTSVKSMQTRYTCVVPQNFPSHISQDMSRIISKWLKIAQELDSEAIP